MRDQIVKTVGTTSEKKQAIHAIVLAFSADPTVRWLYPHAYEYSSRFPKLIDVFGGKAFERETAHYIEDFAGAALWLKPNVHPDGDALQEIIRTTIPPDRIEEANAIFEQMDAYHPAEPHWYLPLIGVDPAHQGCGHGSTLLEYTLAACDREGRKAYLESSNATSIPLYERHGFQLRGEIQAGSSPKLFPMLREPIQAVRDVLALRDEDGCCRITK